MRWAALALAVRLVIASDVDDLHRAARAGNLERLRSVIGLLIQRGIKLDVPTVWAPLRCTMPLGQAKLAPSCYSSIAERR
jgi:hypothetical protein